MYQWTDGVGNLARRMARTPEEAAEREFGAMLEESHGLSPERISAMDEAQVQTALAWIEEAIAAPERFGVAYYRVVSEAVNTVLMANIRYALFPRKALLLERREALREEALARQLAEARERGASQEETLLVERVLEQFREQSEAQRQLRNQQADLQRMEAEGRNERANLTLRSTLRQSWWSRESVASIVGAGLLGVFGLSIAIGMWTNSKAPDLMGNAFLLVLGYFFGQSAERRSEQPKKDGEG
jgi:hypothetical protein